MTETHVGTIYRGGGQRQIDDFFTTIDTLRLLKKDFSLRYAISDHTLQEKIELVVLEP